MSGNGECNIDVTLVTRNVRYVKAWMVDSSCMMSEHNLVVLELDGNNNCGRNLTTYQQESGLAQI